MRQVAAHTQRRQVGPVIIARILVEVRGGENEPPSFVQFETPSQCDRSPPKILPAFAGATAWSMAPDAAPPSSPAHHERYLWPV